MTIESILGALVIGLVLGLLGKLVAPGKQAIPIWLTLLVGVAAAIVGTWIAILFGVATTPGIDRIEVAIQVVLAAVGVSIVAGVYGRKAAVR